MMLHTLSEFISKNTHTFRELLPNKCKHIFRVHIKYYWHFQRVTLKQYYTLFQTSNNTDISSELLVNNTINFYRAYIKQHWHFQKSFWQTVLHTFPEFRWNNTKIFRELLANNTTNFSRVILTFSESSFRTKL